MQVLFLIFSLIDRLPCCLTLRDPISVTMYVHDQNKLTKKNHYSIIDRVIGQYRYFDCHKENKIGVCTIIFRLGHWQYFHGSTVGNQSKKVKLCPYKLGSITIGQFYMNSFSNFDFDACDELKSENDKILSLLLYAWWRSSKYVSISVFSLTCPGGQTHNLPHSKEVF